MASPSENISCRRCFRTPLRHDDLNSRCVLQWDKGYLTHIWLTRTAVDSLIAISTTPPERDPWPSSPPGTTALDNSDTQIGILRRTTRRCA